jgi:meso-butanediol dehydrogenase / (S,S)-butanediol dehydrogenase / diacetyl reductase
MKLLDKVAIVTGAGAGIGLGISQCLAEEGADVAVVDINESLARKTASVVEGLGRKALVVIANVTDSSECVKVAKQVSDKFGKIDILVNNVGGESKFYEEKDGQDYSEEKEWDDTVRLNLRSTVMMCRAVAPYLVARKSGKIVNIASIAGRPPAGMGRPSGMGGDALAFGPMMPYAVSKAGVIQFTMHYALRLAEHNINMNCVCPGVLYTPLYERSFPRRLAATPEAKGMNARQYFDRYVAPTVPLKREQTAEDIGRAVVFFASEESRNITAQTINVDGGLSPG